MVSGGFNKQRLLSKTQTYALKERLRELLKDETRNQIAKRTGISYARVKLALAPNESDSGTVLELARAVGLDVAE